MENLRNKLLVNKDDLVEGTFCYELFEECYFNEHQLITLISDLKRYMKLVKSNDRKVRELLLWIVEGVDQCFISHHAEDDLYYIKNYSADFEKSWRNHWKMEITKYTAAG